MTKLLEIDSNDILNLGDADLRNLIGLLCESDYRLRGLPTKGITWGGHQNAIDGGLDVVVRDDVEPPDNSYIPRKITGFQVKKPDMPRNQILKEMKPNGALRGEIKQLINEKGAYIIVSSGGSTSETALRNRQKAMIEAVQEEDNWRNLYLDFFDRGRVATWVRDHPSLILWVRNKIGRHLAGWRSYENWANTPGGIEEEYIFDDELRLDDGTNSINEKLSVQKGAQKLSSILCKPGKSARLAGLSGVGKTRLVQALFDERYIDDPLNPSWAFYTDISDSPNPNPMAFAELLVARQIRSILIIDNCPPELHRSVMKVCSTQNSAISLLTVEYDVREDIPEETSVFRLEPASEKTIETIIKKRFPYVSPIDAGTIANFSSGNAKVAISIAHTVQQGETLSGIKDNDLFVRLFHQRNKPNEKLLESAEICSLVYSFEGTDTVSEQSELKFLASIVDIPILELYRNINTLKKRDLIQSRSVWRALLPHAIANRLAKRALQSIPKANITDLLLTYGTERLIISFSRRLSYLHDCEIAIEIANDWLQEKGWLGKENCNFNQFGMNVFRNIAIISPQKTLEAIERAAFGKNNKKFISIENNNYYQFVKLLRQLSYDPELFNRSVNLICQFALSEDPDENSNSTWDLLKSLFYLYLSGTHAPPEMRAKFIEQLSSSADKKKQKLSITLLDATIEAWHFSSFHGFSFGARPRDFGYHPNNRKEIHSWYKIFIELCKNIALSNSCIAEDARGILVNNFRGLWTKARMFDELEVTVKQINTKKPWNDVWISIRSIIQYDSKSFKPNILERLYKIENIVKPKNLIEQARIFGLSDQNNAFDLEDSFETVEDISSGWDKIEKTTYKIGTSVAQNTEVFKKLLPEIITSNCHRLNMFILGITDGYVDKKKLWQSLYDEFKKTHEKKRSISALIGFLSACAESDRDLYNSILDNMICDPLLAKWFPIFQTTSKVDLYGLKRLHKAINKGIAKIDSYKNIGYGRAHSLINDDDLSNFLTKILSENDGIFVVIEILNMRFHGSENKSRVFSNSLLSVSRKALSLFPFAKKNVARNFDFHLSQIAKKCLYGEKTTTTVEKICKNFIADMNNSIFFADQYSKFLNLIAEFHPFVFLTKFLGDNNFRRHNYSHVFSDIFDNKKNPLNKISDDDIIIWCDENPHSRYTKIASSIQLFSQSKESKALKWNPIVYKLIEKAPSLDTFLKDLSSLIYPSSYSGSLTNIIEKRALLIKKLCKHDNAEVQSWANKMFINLQETIRKEHEREEEKYRNLNESFE